MTSRYTAGPGAGSRTTLTYSTAWGGGGRVAAGSPASSQRERERERERERQSTGKRVPTAAKVEMQREKASNETASVRKAVTGCVVCPRRWCCSVGDPSTSLLISAQ